MNEPRILYANLGPHVAAWTATVAGAPVAFVNPAARSNPGMLQAAIEELVAAGIDPAPILGGTSRGVCS